MQQYYRPFSLTQLQTPTIPRLPETKYERISTAHLLYELQMAIEEVKRRAFAGETEGLRALVNLTCDGVDGLEYLYSKDSEKLKPLARSSIGWPAYLSPHNDRKRRNQEILENLEVGKDALISVRKKKGARKQWDPSTLSNKFASAMLDCLTENRELLMACGNPTALKQVNELIQFYPGRYHTTEKLPAWLLALEERLQVPLNKTNASEFFEKVAWPMFLESFEGHPERDQELRLLGKSRAKRVHDRGYGPGTGTYNSTLREGIKRNLSKSFVRLIH